MHEAGFESETEKKRPWGEQSTTGGSNRMFRIHMYTIQFQFIEIKNWYISTEIELKKIVPSVCDFPVKY